MNELSKGDDPKQYAEKVSEKYLNKGYNLNFTLISLDKEIDNILETEIPKDWIDSRFLESELTAYFGETICRLFATKWKGSYYSENSAMNYYTCKIKKDDFEFGPSHFISYYLENGKDSEGSFKDYLYSCDYSKGIFKDFLGGGLIGKIK